MAVAKRRAVDHFRRAETLRRRTEEQGHELEEAQVPDLDAAWTTSRTTSSGSSS
jgi:DNA-directed RNA polymerase specialized sigma24 family protein